MSTDCHKTAFNCQYGTFEFRVMQFGLKNAPVHFQRTMNQMFADMADVCVLFYLDVILIFSKNEQEHRQHVHAVFSRLAENNVHVKHKKCTLITDSIEFLGHIVSHRGFEVCPNKIAAIKDWPVPTIVRDVQSFLGLCNYFRHFISKFAHVAQPLTNLTRKQLEFSWSLECQQAFDALQQKLFDAQVLTVFYPAARSEVWCDARNFAVGAVLIQQDTPDSPWQPVKYLFRYLNSVECNYSATEREFVGFIQVLCTWTIRTIRTDHVNLQWLTSQPHLSCRQVRWLKFMSEFDLTITHVPGKANIVADALLRHMDLDPVRVAAVSVSVESNLLAAIWFAQEQDSLDAFRNLKRCAIASDGGMCKHNGLVCCMSRTGGWTIVVPDDKALKQRILALHHDSRLGGRLGPYRMIRSLST